MFREIKMFVFVNPVEHLLNIAWSSVWNILKDTLIPHLGTLIFNSLLFLIIGLFLSILYVILLVKKGVFKRKPKYYNWAVKLYIPILIVSFIIVFAQIGFFRGINKILFKEKVTIVSTVYDNTLGLAFQSEESKNNFVNDIQSTLQNVTNGSDFLIGQMKRKSQNFSTGISALDEGKNKIAIYLIKKKANEIYKTSIHQMYKLARDDINFDDSLSTSDLSEISETLLRMSHKDIEKSTKGELTNWFINFLESQYYLMVKSLLVLLVLIMSIPVFEFFIYKKLIEPNIN